MSPVITGNTVFGVWGPSFVECGSGVSCLGKARIVGPPLVVQVEIITCLRPSIVANLEQVQLQSTKIAITTPLSTPYLDDNKDGLSHKYHLLPTGELRVSLPSLFDKFV